MLVAVDIAGGHTYCFDLKFVVSEQVLFWFQLEVKFTVVDVVQLRCCGNAWPRCEEEEKCETRMAASILTQDPKTWKVEKKAVYSSLRVVCGLIKGIALKICILCVRVKKVFIWIFVCLDTIYEDKTTCFENLHVMFCHNSVILNLLYVWIYIWSIHAEELSPSWDIQRERQVDHGGKKWPGWWIRLRKSINHADCMFCSDPLKLVLFNHLGLLIMQTACFVASH